jgi:hypothetical protein
VWLVLFQISRQIFSTSMQGIVTGLSGWISNLERVRRLFHWHYYISCWLCRELHIAAPKWDTISVLQLHSNCYFCPHNI